MFHSILAVAIFFAAVPFVAAIGNARVVNNCSNAVTLWSVGGSVSGPYTLIARGGSYSEAFSKDPTSGGRTLKITLESDGLYTGKPQTSFAYNLDGSQVWYDLSDVFGDPFSGRKLVEASTGSSCPAIVWETGVPPAGSQVKVCTSDRDVILTLCSS